MFGDCHGYLSNSDSGCCSEYDSHSFFPSFDIICRFSCRWNDKLCQTRIVDAITRPWSCSAFTALRTHICCFCGGDSKGWGVSRTCFFILIVSTSHQSVDDSLDMEFWVFSWGIANPARAIWSSTIAIVSCGCVTIRFVSGRGNRANGPTASMAGRK